MREKIRKKIGAICLYVCLFFLMIVVIDTKENYHGDEIFTYGLSNHNNGITMKPQRAPYSYAPAINAYLEYMTVEKGEEFQFSNVWANQAQDVHPPLYYSIIHFLSSLYSGKFTKWIAGGVNILFMLLTFFVFRKIMDFYKIEGKDKVIFSLFFVLNTGILMAVSFFRMYVVVMFEVTLITWLILKFKGNEKLKFYIALLSISIVGALTHYYFIVYLFFVCLFYGIFLLSNKRWVNVLYLILTMTCAGFLAFLILLIITLPSIPAFAAICLIGSSKAFNTLIAPVNSSPLSFEIAFLTFAIVLRSAIPPPGMIPSSTAARVAAKASSIRNFFSFISISVAAPTLITATPPASFASLS